MINAFKLRPYNKLAQIPLNHIKITDKFWSEKQEINKCISLPLMLEKLENDHHIDNFRITAGLKDGIHMGDFYYDSDLYKWLEGALYFSNQFSISNEISNKIEEICELIQKSQLKDGYLNTFYSLNFLEKRFTNLLIFHELYCAGHLIEAALAYNNLDEDYHLLNVAKKFTNLLVKKFLKKDLKETSGHPEIELALVKLYKITKSRDYLNLCEHFINVRGEIPHLRTYVMRRLLDAIKTFGNVSQIKTNYIEKSEIENIEKEETAEFLEALSIKDWLIFLKENLNGEQYQLDTPIREIYNPVGHAVRALYLYSGVADLYSEIGDYSLLKSMELSWLKMIKAKMFITGGTGSIKSTEGFGKDFQLKLENSYSETCAAIANIMWNWRLLLITQKSKYADLIEKLLYNAMLVGQSLDGKKYFYSNHLISNGEHKREEWFKCPCCPTNFIRIIPQLGKYIYSTSEDGIWIHQYIGSEMKIPLNKNESLKIVQSSNFPWSGEVSIQISTESNQEFSIYLRIPEWCENVSITLNKKQIEKRIISGSYFQIKRKWQNDPVFDINFHMKPKLISDELKRKETKGKRCIKCGPLIYCLEKIDNTGLDFLNMKIATEPNLKSEFRSSFLGGIKIIEGFTSSNQIFRAIPYFAWCNRKQTIMRVWIDSDL